jgi:ribose transport system substrate-binding protein
MHNGIAAVFFIIATLLATSSCNRTHVTTVAVIPKASADIYWQSVHAGAVKSSRRHNVRMIWDGAPAETDIAGQMKIVETMINRHVDAIAVAPSDRSALKIVVNRAAEAHIPVVIYDSAIDTDRYATFVATDNRLGGAMGADRLGQLLNGQGQIVMLKTTPGGASTTAREDGFREEIPKKFPGIRIRDERFGMATIAQSLTVAENMLTAYPDLRGIFASSESSTEGASQAIRARRSSAKLVGFDSSPILINQLQAGVVDSLVIQDPFGMGERAVDAAVRALRGESTPKQLFLPPRLVNRQNLNDPAIQAQLKPDLARYLGSSTD